MTLDGLVISLRMLAATSVLAAVTWACELEGDPPTQVPLAQAADALVDAYCERMFDCTCDRGRAWETLDDCSTAVRDGVAALRERAEASGLRYDPACLGAVVDQLDDMGCAASIDDDDDDDGCVAPCNVLHGDVGLGQACTQQQQDSDCAQGLVCTGEACNDVDGIWTCTGTCIDPCDGVCPGGCADDERCDGLDAGCVPLPKLGDDCENEERCAPGLFCNYRVSDDGLLVTATCERLPALGEDCSEGLVCDQELRCAIDPTDGTGVCVGPTADGEACTGHGECDSGYCPAGFCAPLPGKGESCAGTSACARGLECDPEGQVCVAGDALVCDVFFSVP